MSSKWFHAFQGRFYSKLVFALMASFILVSLFMMYLMNQLTHSYQNEVEQKLHRQLAQHMVKDHQLLKQGELDHKALKHAFHSMMVLGPAFEFYVLDQQGNIQTYSAEPGKVKRESVSLAAINKFLSSDAVLPIVGDDPRSHSRQKIFSAAEIRHDQNLVGYLYIIIGGEKYDDVVDVLKESHIIKLGLWGVIASLVFILLTLMFVFALLTKPLRKLSEDMHLFRKSGFKLSTERLQNDMNDWNEKGDEIHRLGATFRAMSCEMQHQYEKVKTTDELRKELISYVSHDLRTPLSALLGYLETWQLSKDKLSDTEKDQLVSIALENGQHISNLVEQLFELARLDSDHVALDLESVSLADLSFDVVQSLSLLASSQNISLQVIHPENDALLVQADLPKLERVFVNLIDNAIRHCQEGDEIKVQLERVSSEPNGTQDSITVSIQDSGSGIPESDLPFIFDAYYRAGNSTKSKKGNSGLGLAISKKIIELHQSELLVSSELGKGSTFSFKLRA
ncbi:MAG: sensor histidine kinase [Oleiphilus sp.]